MSLVFFTPLKNSSQIKAIFHSFNNMQVKKSEPLLSGINYPYSLFNPFE